MVYLMFYFYFDFSAALGCWVENASPYFDIRKNSLIDGFNDQFRAHDVICLSFGSTSKSVHTLFN